MSEHGAIMAANHDDIRRWVEERGGRPATVESTAQGDEAGILRIDVPERGDDEVPEAIDWDTFFAKFDEKSLAFPHQETTADGKASPFPEFVPHPAD